MLFKKRNEKQKTSDVKKRAERYVSITSEATKLLQNDIANIPDDISGKDIESMFVSLIMLLVSKLAIGTPSTNQQIHTDRPPLNCRDLLQKTA